ncbi:hypothetical protein PS691_03627 [Pseudomonas fluorescens]|uniref:Uncharacterized protein n=1 Tax=Pseudomonas fluorescens TaxID=294 RepID=A0A5E7DPY0_PSEFL|nr:hypothetical protein PS691_03627 [Pseudomonas fluorescens]
MKKAIRSDRMAFFFAALLSPKRSQATPAPTPTGYTHKIADIRDPVGAAAGCDLLIFQAFAIRQTLLNAITPTKTTAPAIIPATALSKVGTISEKPPVL